ncbi:hypothetical protein JD79_02829 [Geodermatophilus normandii]|uniref:Uncharacterized protein n=1 Tax=Geodermatophilus normandii TaxID=1137989 RepID=A0A317QL80_9ACTN|nr:hypothetical protein [Geodermatophilus normandii]PWW23654.1 hypothetical protein JD79_02829 [Geodermatophilus normandii]
MSLSTTPAPARTDAAGLRPAGPAPRPVASTRSVRRAGIAVATGSAAWAAATLAFGIDPVIGWQDLVYELTALLFQFGLVALVSVQLTTGAIGTGRLARTLLHVEHVLLGLAIVSTGTSAFLPQYEEEAWYLALDAFWPLSMVGMFLIGIRIAIAGRWTGAARWWPLGAESWAPINIPVAQIAPAAVPYTAAGHLLVGYVALGIVLATRPHLTGARD